MELAEKIREMQGKKDPINTEWLKDAIMEYFQARATRKMFIGLNNAIKKPQRKAIGKTAYDYYIPKTWEMRVLQWASEEGFTVSVCNGNIILEI